MGIRQAPRLTFFDAIRGMALLDYYGSPASGPTQIMGRGGGAVSTTTSSPWPWGGLGRARKADKSQFGMPAWNSRGSRHCRRRAPRAGLLSRIAAEKPAAAGGETRRGDPDVSSTRRRAKTLDSSGRFLECGHAGEESGAIPNANLTPCSSGLLYAATPGRCGSFRDCVVGGRGQLRGEPAPNRSQYSSGCASPARPRVKRLQRNAVEPPVAEGAELGGRLCAFATWYRPRAASWPPATSGRTPPGGPRRTLSAGISIARSWLFHSHIVGQHSDCKLRGILVGITSSVFHFSEAMPMRKHNRPKEFRQSESGRQRSGAGAERQTVRRERRLDGAGRDVRYPGRPLRPFPCVPDHLMKSFCVS